MARGGWQGVERLLVVRWSREQLILQSSHKEYVLDVAHVSSGELGDALAQLQQMKQMGGLGSLMDKLPTQLAAQAGQLDTDRVEKALRRKEGIINSMTGLERRKPD